LEARLVVMSLALARSASKNATAFAAGLHPAAPHTSGGRHMVIARGDCISLPAHGSSAGLLELKERFRQGLEEHAKAVLSLPADLGIQWTLGDCTERSASGSERVVADEPSLDVRLAACQALAEEAMGGASDAARSITELLVDGSQEVRRAALEALVCIAECGPLSAVNAASVALGLSDPGLRWRGHEQSLAIAALAARLRA